MALCFPICADHMCFSGSYSSLLKIKGLETCGGSVISRSSFAAIWLALTDASTCWRIRLTARIRKKLSFVLDY